MIEGQGPALVLPYSLGSVFGFLESLALFLCSPVRLLKMLSQPLLS